MLNTPTADAPLSPSLTLATALPKGERAEWLVEQASQLGAAALQFLECERAVVKPREGGHKMEKWKRLAVESAKQCGRTHLLAIHEALELGRLRSQAQASRVLWLDPGPGGTSVQTALADWPGAVLGLVGPEGGWSPAERRMLQDAVDAGWVRRVRLTQTVLRIETACAALAALVMCR
jgi:16S rRNA (uracil1498-N3)-methyltransferase